MQSAPQNYPFVTLAKGIGILLVIAGHFTCPRYMPESYLELKDWIYSFHMPLFMMLAGFCSKTPWPAPPLPESRSTFPASSARNSSASWCPICPSPC